MWNVFIIDEQGVFQANTILLDSIDIEEFCDELGDELVFFIVPADRALPACLSSIALDGLPIAGPPCERV